jgi:hypothetical protein
MIIYSENFFVFIILFNQNYEVVSLDTPFNQAVQSRNLTTILPIVYI